MAKQLEIIGAIACACCGESVPVKKQANGLAIYTCNWCGNKQQTISAKADGIIRSRMKPSAAPAAAPASNTPAPEEKKPSSGFNLFG